MEEGNRGGIDRRIARLLARVERRDDYGTLLAEGFVVPPEEDVGDPEQWRAEIERQARDDGIEVRTGEAGGVAWAMQQSISVSRARLRLEETKHLSTLFDLVVPQMVANRHEPYVEAQDREETLFACTRCVARGYADTGEQLVEGALFEGECPNPR
jgi:hypothetical protein